MAQWENTTLSKANPQGSGLVSGAILENTRDMHTHDSRLAEARVGHSINPLKVLISLLFMEEINI